MSSQQEKCFVFYDKENQIKGLTTIIGQEEVVANGELFSVEVSATEFKHIKKSFDLGYRTGFSFTKEESVTSLQQIQRLLLQYLQEKRHNIGQLAIDLEEQGRALIDQTHIRYLEFCAARNNNAFVQTVEGDFITVPAEEIDTLLKNYEKVYLATYHNILVLLKATHRATTLAEIEKLLKYLGYSSLDAFRKGMELKET